MTEKIPEARMVGQRDWHILFQDESETEMAKRVNMLEQDVLQLKQDARCC